MTNGAFHSLRRPPGRFDFGFVGTHKLNRKIATNSFFAQLPSPGKNCIALVPQELIRFDIFVDALTK